MHIFPDILLETSRVLLLRSSVIHGFVTPIMSCFHVSARLRVCSSHVLSCLRALFRVGAWCSDPVVVPNPDPCQIITPLVLVGLGLGVGEDLGLGNHIAI